MKKEQSLKRRNVLVLPEQMKLLKQSFQESNCTDHQSAAYLQLIEDADIALEGPDYSVVNKKTIPPGNTKHDYMSLSVYNWPNPNTPDGLPYITRDGYINPEIEDYDHPSLNRMVAAVDTLIHAYVIGGNQAYANKALQLVRSWFINPSTRMNPNMLYAQYIPGNGGFDRPERYPAVYVTGIEGQGVYVAFGGVIEGTRFVSLVDSLTLMNDDPIWKEDDKNALRSWFRDYLMWLLESQHGKDEASCHNNHGSWYCTQVVSYAIYCGEKDIAESFLRNNVPARIAKQIEPNGSFPEELVRADCYHYTEYVLAGFINLALLADSMDIDLWNFETKDGRGIKKAIDWIMPYFTKQELWNYRTILPISSQFPSMVPILYYAARAYENNEYLTVIKGFTEYDLNHRYRLLFPEIRHE